MSALDDVLHVIAGAAGAPVAQPLRVGDVTLTETQAAAADLVRHAMAEFGGALLADAPGTGKTFIALAVAAGYTRCIVAAPASLLRMWRDAAARCPARPTLVSLESLSRGRRPAPAPLVIVDEAHRVANPRARRYVHLATLARDAHILLLTATPVRNRTAERDALLGLFLGRQGRALDEALLARCIVRRAQAPRGTPRVEHHAPFRTRSDPRIADMLLALPPPIALADGDPAAGLVAAGLARGWASSLAALDRMLVRRLHRGAALAAALDAGRLPTRDEVRAWVLGDDAMQLALPFVATAASGPTASLRDALDRHVAGIRILRSLVTPRVRADIRRRSTRLIDVCDRHPGAITVAFTCFEATARACFAELRSRPRVVLLTGRRTESGAGPLARDDVLAALGPPRDATHGPEAERMRIRLVIATDLLSEGVNLQGASVIVHLDDPWTPAAIEQRVGRAARMGATHDAVHVYRFREPRGIATLTRLDRRLVSKRRAGRRAVQPGETADELRRVIAAARRIRSHAPPPGDVGVTAAVAPVAAVASCSAAVDGFVAAVRDPARVWLVTGSPRASGRPVITDDPRSVLRLIAAAQWTEREAPAPGDLAGVTRALSHWASTRMARTRSGADRAPSVAARQLLARLDRMVVAASYVERPVMAARVGRIRGLVASARGAGIELRLKALLGHQPASRAWLDDVERVLEGRGSRVVQGPIEPMAILVLRAPEPARAAGPSPASPVIDPRAAVRCPSRRAAWPGTAAPR